MRAPRFNNLRLKLELPRACALRYAKLADYSRETQPIHKQVNRITPTPCWADGVAGHPERLDAHKSAPLCYRC